MGITQRGCDFFRFQISFILCACRQKDTANDLTHFPIFLNSSTRCWDLPLICTIKAKVTYSVISPRQIISHVSQTEVSSDEPCSLPFILRRAIALPHCRTPKSCRKSVNNCTPESIFTAHLGIILRRNYTWFFFSQKSQRKEKKKSRPSMIQVVVITFDISGSHVVLYWWIADQIYHRARIQCTSKICHFHTPWLWIFAHAYI